MMRLVMMVPEAFPERMCPNFLKSAFWGCSAYDPVCSITIDVSVFVFSGRKEILFIFHEFCIPFNFALEEIGKRNIPSLPCLFFFNVDFVFISYIANGQTYVIGDP